MRRLGIQKTAPVARDDLPPTPAAETTPAPELVPAYFHKSPIAIYDLTAPIPAAGTHSQWTAYSKYDCEALEAHFQARLKKEQQEKQEKDASADKDSSTKSTFVQTTDANDDLLLVGIERLHCVDLAEWKMKPVYWTSRNASATYTPVRRGTWFYAAGSLPVDETLSESLENGYHEVKPWTMAYEAELDSAGEIGEQGEAKLKYNVGDDAHGQYVIYRDGKTAWVGSRSIGSKLVKSLYSTIGRHRREAFVEVYRGYDFGKAHPAAKMARDKSPAPSGTQRRSASMPAAPEKLRGMQGEPPAVENEDGIPRPVEVSDLILIIHGIGQKLAETSEGWTFTHAVTKLRLLIHEQMRHKDVTPLLRDDFCPQVLPINWRGDFDPDAPPARHAKQDSKTNMFSLDDITIDAIPAVRELVGKVIFDIPYYMSHHKPRMIEAVVREANRIYALWLRNNKDFEKRGGRVHIICHSLGSAISFDVLSNQPNDVKSSPSLYDSITRNFSAESAKIREGPSHFTFNTTNLICAGSPAAFFLLLKQHHLIPRRRMKKGNPATKDDKLTATQGTYGSLAVEELYNVFYATDPIAYQMNATVDSDFAQSLPPTQVPSAAQPFFSTLRLPFSTLSNQTNQSTAGPPDSAGQQPSGAERPDLSKLPSQVELEDHDFSRESVADQRLHLLNENGQLDYVLPMSSYIDNQYLSMVYAHQGYWDSREFARLVVVECGRRKGEVVYRGVKRTLPVENLKKLPPR